MARGGVVSRCLNVDIVKLHASEEGQRESILEFLEEMFPLTIGDVCILAVSVIIDGVGHERGAEHALGEGPRRSGLKRSAVWRRHAKNTRPAETKGTVEETTIHITNAVTPTHHTGSSQGVSWTGFAAFVWMGMIKTPTGASGQDSPTTAIEYSCNSRTTIGYMILETESVRATSIEITIVLWMDASATSSIHANPEIRSDVR